MQSRKQADDRRYDHAASGCTGKLKTRESPPGRGDQGYQRPALIFSAVRLDGIYFTSIPGSSNLTTCDQFTNGVILYGYCGLINTSLCSINTRRLIAEGQISAAELADSESELVHRLRNKG